MSVEISLPDHIIGDVLANISGKRGGRVLGIKSIMARFSDTEIDQVDMKRKCLNALIPLSEMVGYTTYLRSISKGEAVFVMNFSHYERLSG
jgi:elongation factor G